MRKSYNDLFYFLGFFTELLIKSKLKFHRLFRRTYGIIYERNSDVFIDFFRDLESYYDHGNVRTQKIISMIIQKSFIFININSYNVKTVPSRIQSAKSICIFLFKCVTLNIHLIIMCSRFKDR